MSPPRDIFPEQQQHDDRFRDHYRNDRWWRTSSTTTTTLVPTFAAKWVLEVFGSGGAIWGFSDVCGLRHASNHWFWRPVAMTVACLFAMRWFVQLMDALDDDTARRRRHHHGGHMIDSCESFDAESTALVSTSPHKSPRPYDGITTPSSSPRSYNKFPGTPETYVSRASTALPELR
jgi:hypothetical protein